MSNPLALVTATLLALSGIVVSAESASAVPQVATSWTVVRGSQPDGISIEIETGETGIGRFTTSVGPEWSGWAQPKKKKWEFTAQRAEISAPWDNFDGYWGQYWEGSSSVDPECLFMGIGTKYTVKLNSCIDTVSVVVSVFMESEAAATTEITSNISEIAFAANKSSITESGGRATDASFSYDISDTESLSIDASTTDYVKPILKACVNEDLVEVGDEALVSLSASLDGSPLSESNNGTDPWVSWGISDGSTFVVEPNDWSENVQLEDVEGNFEGQINLPDTGTVLLTASAEMTIDGDSILESCPSSGSGFADPLDVSAPDGTLNATATTLLLPDNFAWSDYVGQQQYLADGFGGIFSYPLMDMDVSEDAIATHFDSSGPQNSLNENSGYISPPGLYGTLLTGRWSDGGSQVLSVGLNGDDNWVIENRPMSTGPSETATLSQRELDPGCGVAEAHASSVWPISAPTAIPLVWVNCSKALKKKKYAEFSSIARVDFNGEGSLAFVTNPTPSAPKQLTETYVQSVVNPRATGADSAAWIYTENADAAAKKPSVSNRTVTTIGADGTVAQIELSTDPFPGENPIAISLTAGSDPGDWLGIGEWESWDEVTGELRRQHRVITVTDSSSISVGDELQINDPDAEYLTEITALSTRSDSQVVLSMEGNRFFDGEDITYFASSVLNLDDGSVSIGEVVSNATSSYFDRPSQPRSGFDSQGNMVVYWITSATEYQVVTWDAH